MKISVTEAIQKCLEVLAEHRKFIQPMEVQIVASFGDDCTVALSCMLSEYSNKHMQSFAAFEIAAVLIEEKSGYELSSVIVEVIGKERDFVLNYKGGENIITVSCDGKIILTVSWV
jgi:hypothetical protein